MTFNIHKFGEHRNGRRVPNGKISGWTYHGIFKNIQGNPYKWISYRGRNEYNCEDKQTIALGDEAPHNFQYLLEFKLQVTNGANFSKQLTDPSLNQFFTDSQIRDETSDFKIICEGEELKSHKFILGLRSDFFKTMFNGDMKEAKQGFLNIEEFKLETMKSFHKYLYTDSVDQSEIDVDLLRAAHMYDFKRLVG